MSQRPDRITRAIQKSERLCPIAFSVLIIPRVKKRALSEHLTQHWKMICPKRPKACVIAADPVNRHVSLMLPREIEKKISQGDLQHWLRGVQDDLYSTHFENALALGVLTLAMALSPGTSEQLTSDGRQDAPA